MPTAKIFGDWILLGESKILELCQALLSTILKYANLTICGGMWIF